MSSVSAEKRAALLAAETVLLKLDAARDRLTAVELQARLREVQEQRAAELSDAVANHDAESALSALIAAEADGLITPDFVDLINSSARRVTAHKRGAEASDAERAFYLSLYITSHEAARLVSDFFGGPSSDAMQGWVGSYPHMKPGTKETDVEANIEHNIGVWTRQGVDVCDEDVEMYSCDDATATQARLNAGVVVDCGVVPRTDFRTTCRAGPSPTAVPLPTRRRPFGLTAVPLPAPTLPAPSVVALLGSTAVVPLPQPTLPSAASKATALVVRGTSGAICRAASCADGRA